MSTILFYKVNDLYGEFSNFSPYGFIDDDGKKWATSEHYFQAKKFIDLALQDRIRMMASPLDAALEGRKRENVLREDWEFVKEDIMLYAVYQKFSQNSDIKELLLSTNDSEIIEHTSNDSYWGDGGDGSGMNRLGYILMIVRDKLR